MLKCQNIAAGCVCFQGAGVLITGESGSGKSSLALALIEQGAFLVSDDRTDVYVQNSRLYAKAPQTLKGVLEVRGVGLARGFKTVESTKVDAVLHLTDKEPERLPGAVYEEIAGQKVLSFSLRRNDFFLTNRALAAINLARGKLFFYMGDSPKEQA